MSLEEVGRRNRKRDDGGGFFSLPGCCLAIGVLGVVGAIAVPNMVEARK